MNVATVKTGRRGRPRYPRLSGFLYSTQFFLGDSPVLRLVSPDFDLFGEDSIFILSSSRLPARVSDDLAKGENPLVEFMTSGKPSFSRVSYFNLTGTVQADLVIPLYHGICLSRFLARSEFMEFLRNCSVSGLSPAR